MPTKMELKARARIRKGLRKYAEILRQASQQGKSEEDTSTIVQSMLVDLLGYDRFSEITGQYEARGHWADFAVKVDETLYFFVEVKSLGAKLRDRDLFQVVSYSRQYNLEWAVLTTADVWQCHRVVSGQEPEEFFEIRVLDPTQPLDEQVSHLYLLTKEGFSRGALRQQWAQAECFRPERLLRVLLSDEVLRVVRKAVHRESPGRRLDVGELREALARGVIRGDLYDAIQEAGSETRPKRRRRRRRAATVKAARPEQSPSESKGADEAPAVPRIDAADATLTDRAE